MKSFLAIPVALAAFLISSNTSAAFSEGFKKSMTEVQAKIMLRGQKVVPSDVKAWWDAYDKEIIGLLSNVEDDANASKKEEELNKETQTIELSTRESKGTEIEDIDLGYVSIQFHKLDKEGGVWLAVLSNRMYSGSTYLPFGTVRFYKQVDGQYRRVGALDEMSGPWDKERIQFSAVQFQPMGKKKGAIRFATFHRWPTSDGQSSNRSQIVWQFKDEPKVVLIVPEVDWHTNADGTVAQGRGEAYEVP